ncbi:hypothetical protein CIP107570_00107 [Corynebacterium diphtheriae]|nr:hypothetical protein CIP107570_00107 [Corynebacterium diphtheriae]
MVHHHHQEGETQKEIAQPVPDIPTIRNRGLPPNTNKPEKTMNTPLNNAAIYILVTALAYLATGWTWTLMIGTVVTCSAIARHIRTDKA